MRLSSKLILLLLSAVISVMAVYALVTVSRTQDRMQEELEKMADHLGMALSVGVLHHLEEDDTAGVRSVVEQMARYEDIVDVTVLDASGHEVATTDMPERRARALRDAVPYSHRQEIVDESGRRLGSLAMEITGHSLRGHVEEARNWILLTIAVLTVVISGSIVFFSRRYLAGPLRRLAEGADAIGRGDFSRRIDVRGEGEIAALARAFNQMAGSLQDKTTQLVEEREYIRSVVDSLSEGIVVVDHEQLVTAWNRAMQERHDCDAEQVLGRSLRQALPGLAASPISPQLAELLAGSRSAVEVAAIQLPELPGVVLAVSAQPLQHAGDVVGAVLVLADVTERLRLEAQVQRSDKLAAVGQLAAGIAHEIGTPLNVISGTAEYLRMERAAPAELQTIVDEVRRISELVQRLMHFARHEEPSIESVDLREVVGSVGSLMGGQIERDGIEMEIQISDDLPPLAGDRAQLQQVFVNLVMNAWQAMSTGGRLTIGARAETLAVGADDGHGPTTEIVVEVNDTGSGIETAHLKRIFEPFFTTKEVGQGTGLGLPIVQRIVEDHDGRIDVASSPGQGTTVVLRFPVCPDSQANSTRRPSDG